MNLVIPFAKDPLPKIVSNVAFNPALNAINKSERKISGKEAVRAGKGSTLFILNECTNGILMIKLLVGSRDGVTKAVKQEVKNKKVDFSVSAYCCFIGRAYDFFSGKSSAKIFGKGITRAERRYNSINHMNENF